MTDHLASTDALQLALAEFGVGAAARPWRASCLICGEHHVSAPDRDQATALILKHIDEEHQLVDTWKVGL